MPIHQYQDDGMKNYSARNAVKVEPKSEGVGATRTPAASSALIFDSAVPLPPEIIAPAWPIGLPGGAV